MDPINQRESIIRSNATNQDLVRTANQFFTHSVEGKYSYLFDWFGRPIIQYPQDIIALQEIVWKTKPDLIIETGIAHGGSLIFSSSLLALLDIADGRNPRESPRKVVGIDIDIRRHNREAIERHPLAFKIGMFEGSSIDQRIVDQVALEVQRHERVMVILDSNHTHDHVLQELRMYSPFVSSGLYLVVFDTVVEHLPDALFSDRPWSIGDNPMTAVKAFLATSLDFDVDQTIDNKLLLSVAPSGYLIKK